MAVIRSILLGKARKSVGDVNFFRIKGVQFARTKATFANGRVFSQAQLLQQQRVKYALEAQTVLRFNMFSDIIITQNNRIYNAASRYNLLTKNLVNVIQQPEASNYETFWDLYSFAGYRIFPALVSGNHTIAIQSASVSNFSGTILLTVYSTPREIDYMLYRANKIRQRTNLYTYRNLCVLGYSLPNNSSSPAFCVQALPVTALSSSTPSTGLLRFQLQMQYLPFSRIWTPLVGLPAVTMGYVIAVVDTDSDSDYITGSKSILCSQMFTA